MIDALPLLLADDGYQISRSVRLRSSASAYFNRTPASAGNRKTWTWSGWVKRGTLGSGTQMLYAVRNAGLTVYGYIGFSSDKLDVVFLAANYRRVTTQVFRDASAWYHIVIAVDTTQATSTDRIKVYVNGSQVTAFDTNSNGSQNADGDFNTAEVHAVGRYGSNNSDYFDGYLTEINFIDGQALTPAAFGETDAITGVWKPKKYAGTYGTNGFYLNFSDNSAATAAAIGKDYSGNGNNWTPNNISVTAGATYDSMLDVPTPWADGGNGRGNYATLNPLAKLFGSPTFADGNLRTTAVACISSSTIALPTSGKWYAEATVSGKTSTVTAGICNQSPSRTQVIEYYSDGQKNLSGTLSAYGATYTTNDVIGIAVDCDAATVTFYKNNASQGAINFSAASLTTAGDIVFECYTGSGSDAWVWNFGQRPFAYTPPTGFKALNTQNLPEPTIVRGNRFMDATTYTGNGGSNTVSNNNFQPDLIWAKPRSVANWHGLWDAVRGGNNLLYSNATDAEAAAANLNMVTNATGFSVNGANSSFNPSGASIVAWQWREGATQGFDIVTYTGTGVARTIAHSLGVAPKMMIVKGRNFASSGWIVWHSALLGTEYLSLESTNAKNALAAVWNSTVPDSSSFSLGTNTQVNQNTSTFVAYLFSEVLGFSKFGSYTGNGSADGPFVFCGFRPRWVMIKRSDSTGSWLLIDTARNPINNAPNYLQAESSAVEGTDNTLDILSNGFKLRTTSAAENASGGTYIFAAFAENPFRYSLAR